MALTSTLVTKFFGEVAFDSEEVVTFSAGLPGFEESRRFVLLDQPGARPLVFLQSVEERGLCFAAIPVQQVDATYRMELTPDDAALLQVAGPAERLPASEFLQLALVSLEEAEPTANLLAPVVIHVAARRGVQVIQWESGYSPRSPLGRNGEAACS